LVQALEQEKHALRRKLDSVSGESDGRLSELQADLRQARQQLAEQQALLRSLDRERGAVVHEMADQNQRLAMELKAARRAEDQAASQYRSLREQLSLRRSSLDDHVSQLEGLREEITLLSDRKAELERRISTLVDERESLSLSLEESGDRILLLEKQRHDYEAQIRNQQRDMEELRVANTQLQERLDAVQRLRSSSPLPGHSLGHRSLFNEIEMSSSSSADDDANSTVPPHRMRAAHAAFAVKSRPSYASKNMADRPANNFRLIWASGGRLHAARIAQSTEPGSLRCVLLSAAVSSDSCVATSRHSRPAPVVLSRRRERSASSGRRLVLACLSPDVQGRRSRQLSQLGSSSAGFAADFDEIECDECDLGSEEDKV
ncbi:unnamed protein product, partial [Ixodes hexagonus]